MQGGVSIVAPFNSLPERLQKTEEHDTINHWRDKNAAVPDVLFYLHQINTASAI